MDEPLTLPNIPRVTLKNVLTSFVLLIVSVVIITYVGYQSRFLIKGPQITINEKLPFTTQSNTLAFSGIATNISRIYLNGWQIFTDSEGNFSEFVVLNPGVNTITVHAENRYGQTHSIKHTIVQIE